MNPEIARYAIAGAAREVNTAAAAIAGLELSDAPSAEKIGKLRLATDELNYRLTLLEECSQALANPAVELQAAMRSKT